MTVFGWAWAHTVDVADQTRGSATGSRELEKAAAKYELPLLRAAVPSAKAILAAADGDDGRAAELMEDAAVLYDNAGFVREAVTARRDLPTFGSNSTPPRKRPPWRTRFALD